MLVVARVPRPDVAGLDLPLPLRLLGDALRALAAVAEQGGAATRDGGRVFDELVVLRAQAEVHAGLAARELPARVVGAFLAHEREVVHALLANADLDLAAASVDVELGDQHDDENDPPPAAAALLLGG